MKPKTPRGKLSLVRVTCKNLATNEITSKDSTLIDATGTENVRVRVPRCEHNIACGAGSRLERRRHEQRPTASEIKAAHGSRQSFKTCNGANELAVRTLLRENRRYNDLF